MVDSGASRSVCSIKQFYDVYRFTDTPPLARGKDSIIVRMPDGRTTKSFATCEMRIRVGTHYFISFYFHILDIAELPCILGPLTMMQKNITVRQGAKQIIFKHTTPLPMPDNCEGLNHMQKARVTYEQIIAKKRIDLAIRHRSPIHRYMHNLAIQY